MTLFAALIGLVVKLLGLGGAGFLKGILDFLAARDSEDTKRQSLYMTAVRSALTAEVEARKVASTERVALWGSAWYRLLVFLIIGPPALYIGAVFLVTVFDLPYVIKSVPARFEDWGFGLLMTFIGGGSFVAGVVGAAKQLRK